MTNTSSTHVIKVTDNGTLKATTKEAEGLNSALEKSARTASKVSQARAAGPAFAAAAARGRQDGEDSGTARGIGGLTGAAGRDFAKQSEGLGGLVRLYAVFAANIFAATAAFGALSKAMDTTNMIKGLDQLGASSGMNLGALSKRVFELTDGAVSMREAMEATTKATAAGISGKDLERLAVGAKKASQALGVDMTDALSRLTRGISKLEPELLDELGIFVRVDDAAAKYAQTLGKPVSALTDVQRRAAFAAETLDQVERKFSSINIDANPYSKLAATFANVTQNILELVNKGLGPIAKLFAENSVLLGGALAFIGAKLLDAAIPALGGWKKSLKDAAEQAKKTSDAFLGSFDDKFQDRINASFRIPELTKNLKRAEADISAFKAKASSQANLPVTGKLAQKLDRQVSYFPDSEKDLKALENIAKRQKQALDDEAKGISTKSKATLAKYAAEEKALEAIIAKTRQLVALEATRVRAENSLNRAGNQMEGAANKAQGFLDPQNIANKKGLALQRAEFKATAIAAASYDANIVGVRNSVRNLYEEVKKSNLSTLGKGMTLIQGTAAAVGSRVLSIATAFSNVGMVIGLVAGAVTGAYAVFAKADKQLGATQRSMEDLISTAKLTGEYLTNIFKMDLSGSTSSLMALANIMTTVADKTKEGLKNFEEFAKSADWMDNLWNGIKGVFGKDLSTTLATSLSDAWVSGINAAIIEGRPGAVKALGDLAAALGSGTDKASIAKALALDLRKGGYAAREAEGIVKTLQVNIASSSDAAKALNEKFKETAKLSQEITKSFLPTDNLAKMGQSMMSLADLFKESATNDPRDTLREIVDISNSMDKLKILDPQDLAQVIAAKDKLKGYADLVAASNEEELKYQEKLAYVIKKRADLEEKIANLERERRLAPGQGLETDRENLANIKAREAEYQNKAARARQEGDNAARIGASFAPTLDKTFFNGAQKLQIAIGTALDKAALSMSRVSLLGASGQAAVDMEFNFSARDVAIQIRAINATLELADATERLEREYQKDKASKMENGDAKIAAVAVAAFREEASKMNAKDLIAAIKKMSEDTRNVSKRTFVDQNKVKGYKEALPAVQAKAAGGASVAELKAKDAENAAKFKLGTIAAEAVAVKELSELDSRRVELTKQRGSLLQQALGSESSLALLMTQQADNQSIAIKQKQEIEAINVRIKNNDVSLETAIANKDAKSIFSINLEKGRLEYVKTSTIELQKQETTLQNITQAIAKSNQEFAKSEAIIANTVKIEETLRQIVSARIDLESQMLGVKISLGALSEKDKVQEEARIAGLRLGLELQNQEAALLTAKEAKLRAIKQEETNALSTVNPDDNGTWLKVIDEQNVKRAETLRLYNAEYAAVQQINTLKLQGLAVDTAVKTLLAEQADNMAKLVSATESLAVVFGSVGTALGTSLQALMTFGQTQEKYDLAKAERDKKLEANVDNNDEYFKLKKDEAEADKQNAKDQLTNIASLAGASKKMMSEKTLGYKVLAGVEKAANIASIAMQAVQLQATLSNAATSLAAILPGVAGKIFSQLGAYGFPVVAAALAAISALGGKSKTVNMSGMTAADRQETQGTGISFQNGQKVENGNGVFGDPTEKSDSIRKSLEIMKDNTIEGLKYDRSMLNALESIDASISGVSKGLTAIQGIRTGSSFGTQEGQIGKSGISGLFGSSTSQDITDAGIKVSGTFSELSKGMGSFLQYEDVLKTKTKSGFFGIGKSTSQSLSTNYKTLDESLSAQITDIFRNATGLFNKVAKDMGKSATYVAEVLAQLPVQMNASLKGLSGKDLESAFNAVVSQQLDTASAALFSEMKRFAEFGEGLLETTVRVVDANSKIKIAFDSIGISINSISFETSESLAKLAGGLGEFNDGIKFFSDNFLTEAERLAPVQRNVSATLGELATEFNRPAIAAINTSQAFKDLVLSLNPAEAQSAKLYTELIKLAPAFVQVTEPLKKSLTLEEKRLALLNQQIEIYKLEGKELNALYATRAEELSKLDDSLKVGQAYIYALQDEATIKNRLKTAYDKVANSIGSITSSIKNLQSYSDSLKLGAQSNLSPSDKYREAKDQAMRVAGLASGVLSASATAAEIQAKNDAINQLPTVSAAFLDASRVLFASSDQYNKDFSYIQKLIDSTTTSLIDQKTDAQNQLDRLDQQVSSLSSINDNTASMAGLLQDLNVQFSAYNLAITNTATAAVAAGTSGYTVNSIDMTSLTDMFTRLFTPLIPLIPTQPTIMPVTDRMTTQAANDSTVRAVEALTTEVAGLRADAQAQAQAVVAVTVETSNQITEAVEDSYSGSRGDNWGSRNVVNLR